VPQRNSIATASVSCVYDGGFSSPIGARAIEPNIKGAAEPETLREPGKEDRPRSIYSESFSASSAADGLAAEICIVSLPVMNCA
jgi:hypothetical protein